MKLKIKVFPSLSFSLQYSFPLVFGRQLLEMKSAEKNPLSVTEADIKHRSGSEIDFSAIPYGEGREEVSDHLKGSCLNTPTELVLDQLKPSNVKRKWAVNMLPFLKNAKPLVNGGSKSYLPCPQSVVLFSPPPYFFFFWLLLLQACKKLIQELMKSYISAMLIEDRRFSLKYRIFRYNFLPK